MSKCNTLTMLRQSRKILLSHGLKGDLTRDLSQHINQLTSEIAADRQQAQKFAALMNLGKGAADSLRSMVAALECDYDRLEELRDDLEDFIYGREDFIGDNRDKIKAVWAIKNPEAAQVLAELEAVAGECTSREDAEQRIQEDALSVEVRSEWHAPGNANGVENTEFQILLSTGGPAMRIIGELHSGEPDRAWLEVQDWGMPWTEYREEGLEDVLLTYAGCFYFGEG